MYIWTACRRELYHHSCLTFILLDRHRLRLLACRKELRPTPRRFVFFLSHIPQTRKRKQVVIIPLDFVMKCKNANSAITYILLLPIIREVCTIWVVANQQIQTPSTHYVSNLPKLCLLPLWWICLATAFHIKQEKQQQKKVIENTVHPIKVQVSRTASHKME